MPGCHEDHFREWSVSPHAYAQLSPVFNAFSNKLLKLTNGTIGDFCIRCHTPTGMALHEPMNISNMDRPPTSREGVTCVVCHRINQPWGKISPPGSRSSRATCTRRYIGPLGTRSSGGAGQPRPVWRHKTGGEHPSIRAGRESIARPSRSSRS